MVLGGGDYSIKGEGRCRVVVGCSDGKSKKTRGVNAVCTRLIVFRLWHCLNWTLFLVVHS